ncbi:MAG: signal peptide peptidase SppA [Bacteroidaceae bacterium]|nr:signal peptide peptidase SppA [Bacteroidaceae bacterium]
MKKKNYLCVAFMVAMLMVPVCGFARKGKVLKIDFKNPIVERMAGGSTFDLMSLVQGTPGSVTLLSYVKAIDAAAEDKNISMIYMTPDNISAGIAQLEEIRTALERFKKSGKQIVAYCENLNNGSYYMASVADKIILDPASESMLTGVGSQMIFLKDLFDALGVDVQLIRHGKYKSAGEMYTRSSSSPENRLQNEELINSVWNTMSSQIAQSRGFTREQFKNWVENLDLCTADDFKDRGLIDETWYKDEVDNYLCEQNGVKKISDVNFVKINKYASKVKKGSRKNRIAVVFADGEIVNSGSNSDIVGSKMAATLKKVREDKKIKAVVFRVNSPGGSAQAAEAIRHEIQLLRAEKPVIVSFGDYAASGGYWISAESDYIFSDNNTITGSIGVFGLVPSVGDAIRKNLKVNIETLGTSSHSDMMSGMRMLNESEMEYMQKQIEKIYDDFTGLVSNGRGISKDSVDAIGQGRVWSGTDALRIGLVDCEGGLQDAIDYTAAKMGWEKGEFRISEYPMAKDVTLLQILSGNGLDDPDENLTTSAESPASLIKMFPALYRMRELRKASFMLRMEDLIEIK